MDWFKSVQKQAQDAAASIMTGEAAGRARLLAQQATSQAKALAEQATVKAKDIAKEAVEEAEKSLAALRTGSKVTTEQASDSHALQRYGITEDLQQFVSSLTYSTFSDYPMATLSVPTQGKDAARLSMWQETHARLILERVKQLQDLRFVLCPKRMDEYTFWTIYFTLSKRYLPAPEQQEQLLTADMGDAAMPQSGSQLSPAAAPLQASAAGSTVPSSTSHSTQVKEAGERHRAAASEQAPGSGPSTDRSRSGVVSSDTNEGSDLDAAEFDKVSVPDNDPELDAYLQEALHEDGKATDAGGSDMNSDDVGDLDDFISQLDAEVNDKQV